MKSLLNARGFSFKRPTAVMACLLIAFLSVATVNISSDAAVKGVTKASKANKSNASKPKLNINQPKTDIDRRLEKLESAVFLQTYQNESQTARLDRLEKEVYSKTNGSQAVSERLAGLEKVIVLPIAPLTANQDSNDAYNQPQEPMLETTRQAPSPHSPSKPQTGAAQSATKRLDELETYLFNKTYPKDTVMARLNRLETQVNQDNGNKQQAKGSIDSRLKALSKTVLGEEQAYSANNPSQPEAFPSSPGVDRYGNPYNQPDPQQQATYNSRNLYLPSEAQAGMPQAPPQQQGQQGMTRSDPDNDPSYQDQSPATSPAAQADIGAALGNLEHELFKTTYPQETSANRLNRLETRVFKQPSPDMPDEDRLERLIAVVAADGDNPKSMHRGGSWQTLLPFLIMIPLMFL